MLNVELNGRVPGLDEMHRLGRKVQSVELDDDKDAFSDFVIGERL